MAPAPAHAKYQSDKEQHVRAPQHKIKLHALCASRTPISCFKYCSHLPSTFLYSDDDECYSVSKLPKSSYLLIANIVPTWTICTICIPWKVHQGLPLTTEATCGVAGSRVGATGGLQPRKVWKPSVQKTQQDQVLLMFVVLHTVVESHFPFLGHALSISYSSDLVSFTHLCAE